MWIVRKTIGEMITRSRRRKAFHLAFNFCIDGENYATWRMPSQLRGKIEMMKMWWIECLLTPPSNDATKVMWQNAISCPIICLRKMNHLFFVVFFSRYFANLDYTKCANPCGLDIMGKPNNIHANTNIVVEWRVCWVFVE